MPVTLAAGLGEFFSGAGEIALAFALIGLYVWVCTLVATYADRRGRSYLVFLMVGLLTSPLVALVAAVVLGEPPEEV
jgi:hypothetical protein